MGCASSKNTISSPPRVESSSGVSGNLDGASGISGASFWNQLTDGERTCTESGESTCKVVSSNNSSGVQSSFPVPAAAPGNIHKYIEGEQVVAGWPGWLIAVAREAIYGWVPLRPDSYEKLEKIGEGTYSNVFKARDLDTGKIVALKKVRFDNFEPESVRFMAREITILRRLNHPNIVKLEGLITSRRSCSIYLVFEYMEHDLSGLSSSPDIKFTESQVKCYMHQLLSGLEHCHSRGIMHRDIKCANLLVSSEGILKIADFGLANYLCNPEHRKPLTTRVVTLWYRPPELLLGSTDYEATVDLWSVGCVFAEIILGKPVLQGRTEVEQIHKIFKLCGSPSEEYWRKTKLPHAKLFRPQQPYEKSLREKFKCLSESAFKMLDTLLSVEPYKRGTSKSVLSSEYFRTKPYACEPSSLPQYPPNKEMDAKMREDSLRKRFYARENEPDAAGRPSRTHTMKQPNGQSNLVERPEEKWKKTYSTNEKCAKQELPRNDGENILFFDLQLMPSINFRNEQAHHSRQASNFSGLVWAKKQKEDNPPPNKACNKRTLSSSSVLQPKNINEFKAQVQADVAAYVDSRQQRSTTYEMEKQEMLEKWIESGEHHDSFIAYGDRHHQNSYIIGLSNHYNSDYQVQGNRIEIDLSGPLLQEDKMDELLEKHERHIRHEVRKSWFQRG